MPVHHGKEGTIYRTSTTYAIAEVTDWTYDEDAALVDDSNISDTGKTYKAGIKDGSGTINCHYDPSNTNGQLAMTAGSSLTLLLYPIGEEVTDRKFTGTVVIGSISRKGGREGLVEATFNYKGVLTDTAITA